MKLLRETVRKLILESQAKDEFDEWLWNVDDSDPDPNRYDYLDTDMMGTKHRNTQLQSVFPRGSSWHQPSEEEVDGWIAQKRDIKRKWNELADHDFWQGPKMKYFHDLTYYGESGGDDAPLQRGVSEESELYDISIQTFLETYKLHGNKDEMSTWGISDLKPIRGFVKYGLLLKGRVTLAHKGDAFVESRSKTTPEDFEHYRNSGLPKRAGVKESHGLLFNEEDVMDRNGKVGECILDNWSVVGIVVKPDYVGEEKIRKLRQIAKNMNLKMYDHTWKEII